MPATTSATKPYQTVTDVPKERMSYAAALISTVKRVGSPVGLKGNFASGFHKPSMDTFQSALVTAPPTMRQRRLALVVVVLQCVACAVVAPFPAHLPRMDSFVPVILATIFVADFITAVLLFSQTSVAASRAILVLANGYLFSALIVKIGRASCRERV